MRSKSANILGEQAIIYHSSSSILVAVAVDFDIDTDLVCNIAYCHCCYESDMERIDAGRPKQQEECGFALPHVQSYQECPNLVVDKTVDYAVVLVGDVQNYQLRGSEGSCFGYNFCALVHLILWNL